MARRRRRHLLVPEARAALDQLKMNVIEETTPGKTVVAGGAVTTKNDPVKSVADKLGIPYQPTDNGDLTTRQAGRIGGQIGGPMVKRLIGMAEQQLANSSQTTNRPR